MFKHYVKKFAENISNVTLLFSITSNQLKTCSIEKRHKRGQILGCTSNICLPDAKRYVKFQMKFGRQKFDQKMRLRYLLFQFLRWKEFRRGIVFESSSTKATFNFSDTFLTDCNTKMYSPYNGYFIFYYNTQRNFESLFCTITT